MRDFRGMVMGLAYEGYGGGDDEDDEGGDGESDRSLLVSLQLSSHIMKASRMVAVVCWGVVWWCAKEDEITSSKVFKILACR